MSRKLEQLKKEVVDLSEADDWHAARLEWRVVHLLIQDDQTCVCGHRPITNLYRIANVKTGATLFPIGSVCIQHFDNPEMTRTARRLKLGQARKRTRDAEWAEKVAPKGWFGGKRYREIPVAYFKYLATLERPAAHLADMVEYYRSNRPTDAEEGASAFGESGPIVQWLLRTPKRPKKN